MSPYLRMLMLICLLPSGSCMAAGLGDDLHAYVGTAQAPKDARLLFTEHHLLRGDPAAPAQRLVLYRCSDGRAFARKLVEHAQDAYAPSYEFRDARGHVEGIRRDSAGNPLAYSGATQPERLVELAETGELVIDAGFDRFIRSRWETLAGGAQVPLAFAVASRARALEFRMRKLPDGDRGAPGVQAFRLAPAGFLGLLVAPIEVEYSSADRWLRRFEGITGIRGDNGRNLSARIEFPQRPAPVPADSWKRWLEEPLQRCAIG